ncbi:MULTISPECIES: BF3164 family lipoprotein [Cyclobacterium]|uniref:Lipoprotein n=1 Tax=Cyclobacterium amurskyense TaxID=320787 RepID=A0A0H4PIP7_9BACT|nr:MULTISPECIES: BF3164 family lipoprotein [Cyclobacterium]AKP52930.1 hypothetical protein CA2015_3550 [Cyclobacterium amurskyense]MBI0397118.1 hypothetical protein [Cyclobacterium marinum]|tara:strand:+ start:13748 stop:14836 length:1089 start_codon:yes stop_codon:yes gene_type:complete
MKILLLLNKNNLLILISGLLLCACKKSDPSNKVFTKETIPKSIELVSQKYYYPELLKPNNLLVKNDFIVIQELTNQPPMHILDKKTLQYLNSKGESGFGPGEITDSFMFDFGNDEGTFWVYSLGGKTYSEFELRDDSHQPTQQIKQKENFITAINLVWATDSSVMTRMANDPARYIEFKLEGDRINEFGTWKEIEPKKEFKGISNFNLGDLHQGKLLRKPNSDIFVHVGIRRDRIEILNRKTGEILAINGPLNHVPGFSIVGKGSGAGLVINEGEPYAYSSACLGNKYIYGLFCGRNREELLNSEINSTTVYVFDYEGNSKFELILDRSLQSIAVDEKSGKLYGITTDRDPGLAVFSLPDNF